MTLFTVFVVAVCYVQKCEMSYNVLGMMENYSHIEWKFYCTGRGICLGRGKGVNVIMSNRWRTCCTPALVFTHAGSCNLLYALFIFKQVSVVGRFMFVFIVLHVTVMYIVPRWLSSTAWTSTIVEWHKLTYFVLMCHKTLIKQANVKELGSEYEKRPCLVNLIIIVN